MNEQNEIEMIFLIFYLAADFYSKFYYNQERIEKNIVLLLVKGRGENQPSSAYKKFQFGCESSL